MTYRPHYNDKALDDMLMYGVGSATPSVVKNLVVDLQAARAEIARLQRPTLAVGDLLHGFCGGYFGRDSWSCKRVLAVGKDWVVAREVTLHEPQTLMANIDPARLLQYTKPEEESMGCSCDGS